MQLVFQSPNFSNKRQYNPNLIWHFFITFGNFCINFITPTWFEMKTRKYSYKINVLLKMIIQKDVEINNIHVNGPTCMYTKQSATRQ